MRANSNHIRTNNLRVIGLCAVSTPPQANKEEKVSLEEQERLIRAWVDDNGHVLVDMLIIPGFSRRFYTLYDLIEESAKHNHDAPARLLQHIQARDFDLLVCRYGSRFAREQSIFGEIVARIIDAGAELHTLADGRIDKNNYRMYIAMGGYASATEVDRLVQGRKDAMRQRAARGLPTSSAFVHSHRLIRDEKHNPIRLEIDPARRRFLDDLAVLLLTGEGFEEMGNTLFERFGHTAPSGHPYVASTLHRLLRTPTFWGHTAQHYSGLYRKHKRSAVYGAWAYDESIEPPPNVIVYRNTHEPAYTGDLAEQVKAEMRRRETIKVGRVTSKHTNPFTGLLVCACCGRRLVFRQLTNWTAYICISSNSRFRHQPRAECDCNPRSIRLETVRAWVDDLLRELLTAEEPLSLLQPDTSTDTAERLTRLRLEITDTERRIANLLMQRADTPAASQTILTGLIQQEDSRLQTLQSQLRATEHVLSSASQRSVATRTAVDELASAWADGNFWMLDADTINRILYSLLADLKIWVHNGQIIDLKPLP